ncbi:hypothetical protein [Nocardia wallacei]|uniref:hypothetical protein n=1 Tax=Nocardia wallacei TaxID=480035 RepID=UPI0024551A6A|nr:hypothetical protein [Nocardia wallacei]
MNPRSAVIATIGSLAALVALISGAAGPAAAHTPGGTRAITAPAAVAPLLHPADKPTIPCTKANEGQQIPQPASVGVERGFWTCEHRGYPPENAVYDWYIS